MKLIKVLFFMLVLAIPVFGINAYFNNIERKCVEEMVQDEIDIGQAKKLCED